MAVALMTASVSLLFARDVPAHTPALPPMGIETTLTLGARQARTVSWAVGLLPVSVTDGNSRTRVDLRLYTPDGEIDPAAKGRFEELVSRDGEVHVLSDRVVKLLFKAAYHFAGRSGPPAVTIVSAWRRHAGRHTSGEALDFKLAGVYSGQLAAYLRGLPRVGVGIYTHPRTQYVHLDVRDQSYHWLDASPPGITWRERQIRDPHQAERDATWTPSNDLPL
jgi:hypothetical protein